VNCLARGYESAYEGGDLLRKAMKKSRDLSSRKKKDRPKLEHERARPEIGEKKKKGKNRGSALGWGGKSYKSTAP